MTKKKEQKTQKNASDKVNEEISDSVAALAQVLEVTLNGA